MNIVWAAILIAEVVVVLCWALRTLNGRDRKRAEKAERERDEARADAEQWYQLWKETIAIMQHRSKRAGHPPHDAITARWADWFADVEKFTNGI